MRPSRTLTISLPANLAREIDRLAKQERRSRSELLREAFRQYVERRQRWAKIFSYAEVLAERAGAAEDDVLRAVKERRRAAAR
jgi:CopG family transcriptional regulator/antitoxin EndoAI